MIAEENTHTSNGHTLSPGQHHENEHQHDDHAHPIKRNDVLRVFFVALAAAAVWFRVWEPIPHISIIGIAAALIGGWPIFAEAFENLLERKMTMELSMTIALLSA
ncbi:MAG: cation-transporting P-type ATPase, partial [Candidatus Eremiobacteraeota bacterium]|nr:cation-transporting P-type ATPase [Candidatus Eremiobacteraeota bacterium]